jgi:hypothetical protein
LSIEQKELLAGFIEKLTSAWSKPEEIRDMYMKPIPPRIGQIRTTIARMKTGLNFMWPKYQLVLSES